MLKVTKFGGSSVANATQISKLKEIVLSDNSRRVVIVSAPGKDETHKSKVTDLLYLLHAHLEYDIEYAYILDSIYERYSSLVRDLVLSEAFNDQFKEFTDTLQKGISKDFLVSRGEYFSALIISEYLGFEFVDAMDIIELEYSGNINYDKTESKVKAICVDNTHIVVPGFYASTPDGQTRVFSRGGSDLTGSVLARVLDASIYENWTDVSGIYVADPRIINEPDRIEKITYNELRELTFRGARVLQQESVIPLEKKDIPIQIKNTNKPEDFGTLITNDIKENGNIITGISGLKHFTALNISKDSDIAITKVLRDVLNLFIRYKIDVEHIPTGIDTFSIISKTDPLKQVYFDFMNDLREVDGVIKVEEEDDISLLAIVGRNMAHIPGVAGRIFNVLGTNKINIKVIAQASKEIVIIIGVSTKDYEGAVQVLYNEFY
jgi:aspartate kinase